MLLAAQLALLLFQAHMSMTKFGYNFFGYKIIFRKMFQQNLS